MDLSVIIVNYNTKDLLKQTIDSVIKTTKNIKYEIIVSDNNSHDGSIEMMKEVFPQIKLIENNDNLGFSKGNNVAIRESKGRYVLLLNSDTVVLDNCLEQCVNYMDKHKYTGVLGCKVVLKNGELDHACRRGFPTPQASLYYMLKLNKFWPNNEKYTQYTLSHLNEDEINEVDSVMGAFMMVRREAIEKVGLLDETFFMYGEDIDWCYRIKEAGYKVVYYPKANIIHYKGASSSKKPFKTIYEFHRAMYIFYNKHYREKYSFLITILVYIGIMLKLVLTLIRNVFKRR
ncbi:N-acetylglucosaminyl-diphospho-decaprenol L-rhamnosyltransferase [Clostridium tepidiprofundi DSM 19306]|uniref:N-acetylglucosaminyl-diphospho-decaprenol L-rhamnosyltransferase n=1 Tax=Clostridium tepidiprofundi DSM 19306 TaxID=1121338 RepID=A0A151ASW8_9CLOT|nr:glycosyltransferase family 2 protein [Clostridium tepidiprofundi]KYH30673.1 N-acetylglucosaminyl-diphospho-decaprenol L-rhamnosyltransferase [Clostridium tepidiprofundi DSM 19306]